MPTRLTRLDCYNRHRLFEHKGAARRLFVSRRRRHGAERPLRVQDTQVHFLESAHSPFLDVAPVIERAGSVRSTSPSFSAF